jgi:hypothetical protein
MAIIKQGRVNIAETEYYSDGGIKREWKRFNMKINKENFFMTYIDAVSSLWNLRSINDRNVLDLLCSFANYNNGIVSLSTKKRKDIIDKLKISQQTLTNSLANLKNLNIITGNNGEFIINPNLFWKGNDEERLKLLNKGNWSLVVTIELKEQNEKK